MQWLSREEHEMNLFEKKYISIFLFGDHLYNFEYFRRTMQYCLLPQAANSLSIIIENGGLIVWKTTTPVSFVFHSGRNNWGEKKAQATFPQKRIGVKNFLH